MNSIPFDTSSMTYFPLGEDIVDVLVKKTQNTNAHFFRLQVAFALVQLASMQRVSINTPDRGKIPVNMYVINLSPSGTGKGHSTNILENEVTHLFREDFINTTFEVAAQGNLLQLATNIAARKGTDPDEEHKSLEKEFHHLGPMLYSFDSGTSPAVKQMRHKLLLASLGSLNLMMDEIGSNLIGNTEVLNVFLELFDMGFTKQKLIKNTKENTRSDDIQGGTPTNMLLYGTPSKLLNGGKTEEEFFSFLDTGYARRCFFGYAKHPAVSRSNMTAEEIYDMMVAMQTTGQLDTVAIHLSAFADPAYSNKELSMSRDVAILLLKYKMYCEHLADGYSEFDDLKKAEMTHRYFKALKLAGAYAFVDGADEVYASHLEAAIKVTEDSGAEFHALLNRERPYVRLCKFICESNKPLTQADLVEDLACYRGSLQQKNEMMSLAIAWGYQNHFLIQKSLNNGIDFFSGTSLEKTDLDKLIISWSRSISDGYRNEHAKFSQLNRLTQTEGLHWCNHHTINGQRNSNSMRQEFNTIVLDVENSVTLATAMDLLKDYQAHFYTTKNHNQPGQGERFRIIMPIAYVLDLSPTEFSEFMENVYDWLPFKVDTGTKDIARKWASRSGEFHSVNGALLDPFPFIPNTSKNSEFREQQAALGSLDNLEKWFIKHAATGSRNNMLLRFALTLADQGYDYNSVRGRVFELNNKLPNKLEVDEISNTVLKTLLKRMESEE